MSYFSNWHKNNGTLWNVKKSPILKTAKTLTIIQKKMKHPDPYPLSQKVKLRYEGNTWKTNPDLEIFIHFVLRFIMLGTIHVNLKKKIRKNVTAITLNISLFILLWMKILEVKALNIHLFIYHWEFWIHNTRRLPFGHRFQRLPGYSPPIVL